MTIISIRQPGYFPYSGFFKKIQYSDYFVYLDDVQYERGDWDNRNKIKTSEGAIWLTVPVYNKFGQKLNEVKISYETNWNEKHIKAIEMNYQKTPYFENYWDSLKKILEKKWVKLLDLNLEIINYINKELGINTKTICSSNLKIDSTGSEHLLEICKQLDGTIYLSGEMGHDYLNDRIFSNENIQVIYEKFHHPVYSQLYGNFIPNLSILDLLFNEGEKSKEILKKSINI
jgi:hypothetical protein